MENRMSSSPSGKKGKSKVKRESKRRKKNDVVASPVVQDDEGMTVKELLPRVPNQVTLVIATKLPWNTFNVLSSVSTAWRRAIQDRLVYDSRVELDSLWPVVIVNHTRANNSDQSEYDRTNCLALYCMRNGTFFNLPPIPQVDSGIPWRSRCISLAGKVYVLGGTKDASLARLSSQEVYMFDVAGQKEWKLCAPMQQARQEFGCGVLNGKIYVFGGKGLSRSEVYDPDSDAWSVRKAIPCQEYNHEVTPVGQELYLHGGKWLRSSLWDPNLALKAYHPIQNKWRVLISKQVGYHFRGRLFVAQRKVYCMAVTSIFLYDFDNKSWNEVHTYSFAAIEHRHTTKRSEYTVKGVDKVYYINNELLAVVSGQLSTKLSPGCTNPDHTPVLVRSKGFNNINEGVELSWDEITFPLSFLGVHSFSMFPTQL